MNIKRVLKVCVTQLIFSLAILALFMSFAPSKQNGKIIQVDIKSILNGRAVTILKNGRLIRWSKGVDLDNGYLTSAAARAINGNSTINLPDSPLIPANGLHPEILLHYSNADSQQDQVAILTDTGSIKVNLPPAYYQKVFLSLTSAYGSSSLEISLKYKDGIVTKDITLPDWYNDLQTYNSGIVYVVHNLGKWAVNNQLTEQDHHNIDAIVLKTDANKILTSVVVKKLNKGRMLLWAATAITSE
jgi:hypothetical protein